MGVQVFWVQQLLSPAQHRFAAAMGEDEAWNGTVKEWLIDEGYCYAGAVAGKADCVIYGAAAMEGIEKWGAVIREGDYEADLKVDEETTNKVSVNETNLLWEIIEKGVKGSYPSGIWLAGVKHTLVREQELEVEGQNVKMCMLSRAKGGCCIASSAQSVVMAFYDEEKNKGEKGGNATNCALKFVGYLFQNE